jgi:protein-tyrosine-phosphatase
MTGVQTVLFVCTGNFSRSILAEAILNKAGAGRYRALSAGSRPKGIVHPQALRLLMRLGHDTSRLRSKSWDEFCGDNGALLNFVVTVCNNAANEVCPVFPGKPAKLHWDIPDPSLVSGNQAEIEQAFEDVYDMLSQRIGAFVRERSAGDR